MKLFLKWLVSALIAAVFVLLAARDWPLDKIMCSGVELSDGALLCVAQAEDGTREVSWSLRPLWLLAAFLVLAAVHFLRVVRWEPLLSPIAKFDFKTLNRVGAISFLSLFVFPLRLGELARPYLIARTGRLRKSAALGTIAVERVMDGLMMALLLALVLFFLPRTNQETYTSLEAGAWIASAVFAAALAMLAVAWKNRDFAVKVVRLCVGWASPRLADKLSGMMGAFIDGLKAMPRRKDFFRFLWLTVVYWAINGFYFYFMGCAFGLEGTIDVAVAYAMMAAVAVGMMIPNSPANVGSFWYFLLLPMALYPKVEQTAAPMAFALAVWALMLAQYALFAGYYLVRGEESMKSLWSIQKEKLNDED